VEDAAKRDQDRAAKMGWGRWDPVIYARALARCCDAIPRGLVIWATRLECGLCTLHCGLAGDCDCDYSVACDSGPHCGMRL
jgi:hypothetical protein